jgi:hypothetical protein
MQIILLISPLLACAKADRYSYHHPVIGVYKFHENWSTETFQRERAKEAGCL